MAINTETFFGRSTSTSTAPVATGATVSGSTRTETDVQPTANPGNEEKKTILSELIQIDKDVKKIQKLIAKGRVLRKKEQENNKKQDENRKREEKELRLEKKKETNLPGIKATPFPKMGFLDRIRQFLFYTLLGSAFVKFGKHIPEILKFTKLLVPAFEFFEKLTGNILNGIVDFIGAGYKAQDKIKEIAKTVGGEDLGKKFDEFNKQFNTFANLAIIAGLAATGGGLDFDGKKRERLGVDKQTGRRVSKRSQTRFLERYGEKAYVEKFGKRSYKGLTGKTAGRFTGRFAGKALGKIPIIGGLVDFIISTVIFKEKPGRAAAKALGATIGSALGTFVPIPFAGTILGGILGDLVGGALYDSIVGDDKLKGKAKGGQATRGGRKVGGAVKRTIRKVRSKPPRTAPQKSIPGKDIGGKKQIEKLFPTTTDPRQKNPLGVLETSSKGYKTTIPLVGELMGSAIDSTMGQRIDNRVFKKFGIGLGYLIQSAIDSETTASISNIQRQIVGLAGGGMIPRTLSTNENVGMKIGERIAKTLQTMVNSKVSNTLQAIRQQLNRQDIYGGGLPSTIGGEFVEANIGANEMDLFQRMVYAEAGGEGKVGMALVARAILNRAGLIQSGKVSPGTFSSRSGSISDVIKAPGQFSPMQNGRINQKLTQSQLDQAMDAIRLAQNPSQLIGLLKNEGLDENVVNKLAAVTGFRNYAAGAGYDPSQAVNEVRYKRHTFNTAGNTSLLVPKGVAIQLGASAPEAMVTGGRTPSSIALTSGQGWRWGRMHKGIDLDGGDGSPISSAQDAKVVFAGDAGDNYGNSVVLRYSNGAETRFAHLKSMNVRTGQSIKAGQMIGRQGSTGRSSASHLHFEYYPRGGAMSYEGYGNAASVMNSYFRYGGNIKPKPLQKPADTAGTQQKKLTSGQTKPDTRAPSITPETVRTAPTRQRWDPSQSGLRQNPKTGVWEKASLVPQKNQMIASGLDFRPYYTSGEREIDIIKSTIIMEIPVPTQIASGTPTIIDNTQSAPPPTAALSIG